jgi:hypothetical protein
MRIYFSVFLRWVSLNLLNLLRLTVFNGSAKSNSIGFPYSSKDYASGEEGCAQMVDI